MPIRGLRMPWIRWVYALLPYVSSFPLFGFINCLWFWNFLAQIIKLVAS